MLHSLTFSPWLRQCRIELGLTQAQLAARADISLSLLRKYESGARAPTRAPAARLAAALGLAGEEHAAFLETVRRVAPLAPPAPIALPAPLALPGWLPAAPTPLLGRADDLVRLVELILATPGSLVTLVGPPGGGKLRLALAAAAVLRPRFADDAHFVELAPLAAPAEVAPLLAALLQARGDEPEAALVATRAGKELLLVLDNF